MDGNDIKTLYSILYMPFLNIRYGGQLEGLMLSGMGHVTDALWNTYLPKLINARILVNLLFHKI